MKSRRFLSVSAKHYKELYELIAALDNEQEVEALLKDLLTPQELDSVTERWQNERCSTVDEMRDRGMS